MQYPASNMRRLAQLHRINPWQAQTGCKSPCCRGQQTPQLGSKRCALAPITRGAIGWHGDGTLWVSNTVTAVQQRTDLPPHGAGDVLMFVLDPGIASLWLGRNGGWHGDPATDPPAWTAAASAGFHPQVQGRMPALRSSRSPRAGWRWHRPRCHRQVSSLFSRKPCWTRLLRKTPGQRGWSALDPDFVT